MFIDVAERRSLAERRVLDESDHQLILVVFALCELGLDGEPILEGEVLDKLPVFARGTLLEQPGEKGFSPAALTRTS